MPPRWLPGLSLTLKPLSSQVLICFPLSCSLAPCRVAELGTKPPPPLPLPVLTPAPPPAFLTGAQHRMDDVVRLRPTGPLRVAEGGGSVTLCPLQLPAWPPEHHGKAGTGCSPASQPQQPTELCSPQGAHHPGWVEVCDCPPCPAPLTAAVLIPARQPLCLSPLLLSPLLSTANPPFFFSFSLQGLMARKLALARLRLER